MRIPQALAAIDTPAEPGFISVDAVIRALLGLTSSSSVGQENGPSGERSAEEILIDAEVDGERYLVIRMPRLNRLRVQLSPREKEIGRMVARGHPNKVIADVLNISSWTVCTHLRRMFAKMGVCSRAAMVAQILESEAFGSDHRLPSEPHRQMGFDPKRAEIPQATQRIRRA